MIQAKKAAAVNTNRSNHPTMMSSLIPKDIISLPNRITGQSSQYTCLKMMVHASMEGREGESLARVSVFVTPLFLDRLLIACLCNVSVSCGSLFCKRLSQFRDMSG
jgi:hypothetical protein